MGDLVWLMYCYYQAISLDLAFRVQVEWDLKSNALFLILVNLCSKPPGPGILLKMLNASCFLVGESVGAEVGYNEINDMIRLSAKLSIAQRNEEITYN